MNPLRRASAFQFVSRLRLLPALAVLQLGISLTASAQSGWEQVKSDAPGDLVAVYFTSGEDGWIAGDDGYLASTNNGGKSWTKHDLGTNEDINEIYFRNEKNGYLVAGRKVFITNNSGSSWRETQLYRADEFKGLRPELLSIRFADKRIGLAIGSVLNIKGDVIDSLVMRTDDGGETWRRIVVPARIELFHLDFSSSFRGWIVGDKGLILATTDGGMTWQKQNSGVTRALFNVDFRDENNGFIVGGGGTILLTEDGGENWKKIATPISETLKRVSFSDDKNGWIVGHRGTILRTSDRGKSWVQQESGTTGNLYGLSVVKKYAWAVGASGLVENYQR